MEDEALVGRLNRWLAITQDKFQPYAVTVNGLQFRVLRDVFSPMYFSETEFYAMELSPWFRPGVRFLDVGTGVGVNAVLAARAGATVVALDINEAAVANVRVNARLHSLGARIDARVSNSFSGVRSDEEFDLIYWNVPFAYREPEVALSPLEESVFDPGYRKNREFMSGARDYLAPGGSVLMGISPTLGSPDIIDRIATESNVRLQLLSESTERGTGERLQLLKIEYLA